MADIASVVASTMKVYGKTMWDNILTSIPLYSYLNAKGNVEVARGPFINESVAFAENTTVAFGDPKAQMSLTEQDPFRMIQWAYGYCKGLVPIFTEYEIRDADGNMAKRLIQNLEDTMTSVIGKSVFASGGANTIAGLDAICSATNTYGSVADANGNVTAISRAATGAFETAWASNVNSVTGTLTVGSGANSMWTMYDTCKKQGGLGGSEPDLIVTTDALYAAYNATLTTNQRYVSQSMANLGFDSIKFRNARVVADPNCPEGKMYFLNTKFLKLRPSHLTLGRIGLTPAHQLQDYLGSVVQAYWAGNLICTRPNSCGVLTGKS
jgi:hypothetical protein